MYDLYDMYDMYEMYDIYVYIYIHGSFLSLKLPPPPCAVLLVKQLLKWGRSETQLAAKPALSEQLFHAMEKGWNCAGLNFDAVQLEDFARVAGGGGRRDGGGEEQGAGRKEWGGGLRDLEEKDR